MNNPMKKMMTVCAVMVGLMVGGVSMPSANACGPYMSSVEMAQMEVQWLEESVERSTQALTEAVAKDDKAAIEQAAKHLITARQQLATAKKDLEKFQAEEAQRQKELAAMMERSKM